MVEKRHFQEKYKDETMDAYNFDDEAQDTSNFYDDEFYTPGEIPRDMPDLESE